MFKHEHMLAGVVKAAKSPRTPAHLRPHLEARVKKMLPNKKAAMKMASSKPIPTQMTDMDGDEGAPGLMVRPMNSMAPKPMAKKSKKSRKPNLFFGE